MLLSVAIILLVLWLLGLIFNVLGGVIHILLIAAVVVGIVHFFRKRQAQ